MASKQQNPRSNRYKKSGKGNFVLAVFIVVVCLLMAGGYLLQRYQQQRTLSDQSDKLQKQELISKQDVLQLAVSSAKKKTREFVVPVPPMKQDYYTGEIPAVTTPAVPKVSGKAELAIVVDDMGSSLQEAQSLAAIGVPINFAIIPGLRHYHEVANFSANRGIEIMIHMPMQPKEYPRRRLESNGLLLEQSDEELRDRLNSYIEQLPQAVGANNHMGSGFTENPEKMKVVLSVLKENNLFFLDSITTPLTVGAKVAKELGMSYARRDVFLDNDQNELYIRGQLAKAVSRSHKTGHAIAICHPHHATIATLAKILPTLSQQGVVLVKISHLIK